MCCRRGRALRIIIISSGRDDMGQSHPCSQVAT
jgi:hypothetical protein